MEPHELDELELQMLLEAVYRRYGYDFRGYARGSLRRRVGLAAKELGDLPLAALQGQLLHSEDAFEVFLRAMSVTVTELFRDPSFYVAFREQVVPILETYPFIKIWHAGCATGEEVYSMAILLHEEGLLPRCRLYGTDYNPQSLQVAEEGVYGLDRMSSYTRNYIDAGGKAAFADYYTASYGHARMLPLLHRSMTYAHHNLVTDSVFGEMQVVLCRNVLIYFEQDLQDRAMGLFHDSLCRRGVLCLGSKESLVRSARRAEFEDIDAGARIYRRLT